MSAATPPTTTAGRRWATPAGPMPRCCPTSASPRRHAERQDEFHGGDGPLVGLPRPRAEPAVRPLRRGGGRGRLRTQRRLQRREPGRLRPLRFHHPATASAAAPSRAFLRPVHAAAEPHRRHPCADRRGSSSRTAVPSPSTMPAATRITGPTRRARSCCRPGAIGSPQILMLSGIGDARRAEGARHRRGRSISPASAATSRTMSTSAWSTRSPSRSRSTATSASTG